METSDLQHFSTSFQIASAYKHQPLALTGASSASPFGSMGSQDLSQKEWVNIYGPIGRQGRLVLNSYGVGAVRRHFLAFLAF